jgi:endoglucanase
MRNITTVQLVNQMGLGINLGNTLEAVSPWVSNPTIANLETSWGSPRITREIIEGYKAAGFDTLRIPVAWSNLMNLNDYTINPTLMNRVQEIVDWALGAGMYAIVNLHWDGGWLNTFHQNEEENIRRYTRIWEQVADRFKDYGDFLLFESQNEELGWAGGDSHHLWNPWQSAVGQNLTNKQRSYTLVNRINQTFVNIIRASGGNNPRRHLLIAGYNTNIDRTVDPLFIMPTDPANRMAIKVHYYDPFSFTHIERDESWAAATWTWGTPAERTHLNRELDKMVTRFINNGIPVVIGEYGMAKQGVTQEEINRYTLAVTEAMFTRGMLPVLWCVQLQANQLNFYYNRRIPGMTDSSLEAGMKAISATRR